MRRVVWTDGGLGVEDAEPGPLPDGMARLRVEACGICGSDLHFWTGQFQPRLGTVPGHEFVGTLLDGPSGLADARYAASPMVVCGSCEHCARQEWNLCRRGGDLVGLGRDGGLAEWVDVPVVNLTALADGVEPVVGMLTEPMAVCVRGVSVARLTADDVTLVLGGGTIGLLTAALARLHCDNVVLSARHEHQKEAARALGIEVIDEADTMTWGKNARPTVVLETVGGHAATLDTGLAVARRGGRIIVLGSFARIEVDLHIAGQKEVSLIPTFAYGTQDGVRDFDAAGRAVGELRSVLPALVTHRFDLTEAAEAFATAADKHTGSIKVALMSKG